MTFVGVVKQAKPEHGYGFIDCKETHALYGRDIFVHKDIVGHDVFRALRKGEVVQFRMQLDEKDQPQAASITNDRIELAESQGRLHELATEVYTPPWPPNLNIRIKRTYQEKVEEAMASMKPQLMVLPDQQIVYIVPLTVPQEKKTAPQETTMFGTDQQQTMYDSQVRNPYRHDYVANPGLDPALPTYRGRVTQPPDSAKGFGFVTSREMQEKYGRDAFLHNKNCPWLHHIELLEKNEEVLFQINLADKGRPSVVRFVQFKNLEKQMG